MIDETEGIRRAMVQEIAEGVVETLEKGEDLREVLEKTYGKGNVWDTEELGADFDVIGFMAPFCVVRHKATRAKGVVEFTHWPRYYFNFVPS